MNRRSESLAKISTVESEANQKKYMIKGKQNYSRSIIIYNSFFYRSCRNWGRECREIEYN